MLASTILMVKPKHFGFNAETAIDNEFQQVGAADVQSALKEFEKVVETLRMANIQIDLKEDSEFPAKPDAIFPNNWVAFLPNQKLVTFPMKAENRRTERRAEWIDEWKTERTWIDLAPFEKTNQFLEGTGSIIFDHDHHIAYMARSQRSSDELLIKFCEQIQYKPYVFDAYNGSLPFYHTNVIMSLGENAVVLAAETIPEGEEKKALLQTLESTQKQLITIDLKQVLKFCGNILQVKNKHGKSFWVMSETAYQALNETQLKTLQQDSGLIIVDVGNIEKIGGGGIRCMMAEVF